MRKLFAAIIAVSLSVGIGVRAHAQETLTWPDCLAEAKKNHPDLISAVETINAKKAAKDITASGLYPQFEAHAGASTSKVESTKKTNSYSYGVGATQLLFDGSKTVNNLKAAGENVAVAQQNYRFASTQVRLDLRTAFIALLKAQELIKVREEIITIRRSNVELLTLRYLSGLEHRGALLTAEASLASAQSSLAAAKRDLVVAQRKLSKEMGRTDFVPMAVSADFSVQDSAQEKPDINALVKNNPTVLEAVAQMNAAAFTLKAAYGNFAPKVSGSASADKKSSHWPPETGQWDMGLTVSLPLFEGGLKAAQLNEARALYNKAIQDERSTRDSAVVSLEQSWASLQDALDTVNVQSKSLEATQERSKIAQVQYSMGITSFDNWTIIEDNYVSAKGAFLDAKANALTAEANWIQAKGETLEYAQE